MHWDHVQGLPFFTPLLREGSSLDVYGPAQDDGRTLDEVVSFTIRPPLFPVSVDELPGSVRFHDTADTEFSIGGFNVMARLIPHLGPTLGFRVECQGRSIAYLSDHQQPFDGSYSAVAGALELVDGVDLLIHDAQYTQPEFKVKATWGHCTIDYAVWLATEAGAKRLALFHHDPARRDDDLDALLRVRCRGRRAARRRGDRRVRGARRRRRVAWFGDRRRQRASGRGVRRLRASPRWRRRDSGVRSPRTSVCPCSWRPSCRIVELSVGALLVAQLARRPVAVVAGAAAGRLHRLAGRAIAAGPAPPCACFGALDGEAHRLEQRRAQRRLRRVARIALARTAMR